MEHVVSLSVISIHSAEGRAKIPPVRVIPFVHAQAELAIENIGLTHTTLQVGSWVDYKPSVWEGKEWWPIEKGIAGLNYYDAVENVDKYACYEPESFEQYVAAHLRCEESSRARDRAWESALSIDQIMYISTITSSVSQDEMKGTK